MGINRQVTEEKKVSDHVIEVTAQTILKTKTL